MIRKKISIFTLFYIYIVSSVSAQNGSFTALYAFGDSILDTGNNNYLLTLMKGNYWPYGWDFDFKVPTGRFGNGRVFSDIVADGLGIKRLVPAYRKLYIPPDDLKTGVCFASGGSGIDKATSRMLRVISAADQLKDFKSYLGKLKGIVGSDAKVQEIISNAVFLISWGNNDIGITFFSTPAALMRGYTPLRYPSKLVEWDKEFFQELYKLGARKFAVMGVLPLGCLPLSRIFMGGFVVFCNLPANKMSEVYNKKLQDGIKSYPSEAGFSGAKFVYVDMYNTLKDVIDNHLRYGFLNEKNGCCCMPTAMVPCPNADTHVFYDFAHPSQKSYLTIAKKLVPEIKAGLA